MLGFGACKMIRRILGFAHVIDFESIQDAALRADCEASALAMAHTLLTHPERFQSVDDVIDAVPRMVRRAAAPWPPRGHSPSPPQTPPRPRPAAGPPPSCPVVVCAPPLFFPANS